MGSPGQHDDREDEPREGAPEPQPAAPAPSSGEGEGRPASNEEEGAAIQRPPADS